MNKKIYFSILLLFSMQSFAFDELPEPVNEIHLVPDSKTTKAKKPKIKEFNGIKYFYSESTYPNDFIKLKYTAKEEIKQNKDKGPYDTHLKENISDIKLAFEFKGIPFVRKENVVGYAAASDYNNGWLGIKEIFTDQNLGMCSLSLYNIKLGHGGARLEKSTITQRINGKPGSSSIEGNINFGFLYTVDWYDNTFVHVFECANMNLDKNIPLKMIDYARLMDKSLI